MNAPQVTNLGPKEAHPDITREQRKLRASKLFRRVLWGIGILLVVIVISQYMMADTFSAKVQIIEEDRVGINPTDRVMDFGDIQRNKAAVRTISIENSGSMDNLIIVWARGEIAGLIKPSHNNFTLNPGKSEKVEFRLQAPDSAEFRYYEGKVTIFKLPKFW